MTVVTRFAPSPTGFLHIGGARTALFNWLFARHMGGKFLLRIEDTDRARSTQPAIEAIIDGMKWLGLEWEGEVIHQFARMERHAEVAHALVERGQAFRCYTTPQELEAFRAQNPNAKFRSPWRNGGGAPPAGIKPAIRLKAPYYGETKVRDHVRGEVTLQSSELDDMILLRSDGTPTYMLAVVVDDHDMGITHVIRGDDHFTNTFRQALLYEAMGWNVPEWAHIPLIHGADGAKLSKRHGALGVDAYRDMGYLPEALRNYLLRLGWAHGDDEIISTKQAIEWFNLEGVGKSPSRFDFVKLENLNGHYIREADNARLVELAVPLLEKAGYPVDAPGKARLLAGMPGLKARAKTIVELAHNAEIYVAKRPVPLDEKAQTALTSEARQLIQGLRAAFAPATEWKGAALEQIARGYAEQAGLKLGAVAQPLRAALTGRAVSPPVFEVMEVLGREEALARLQDIS